MHGKLHFTPVLNIGKRSRDDADVKAAFAAVVKQKKKSAPKGAE